MNKNIKDVLVLLVALLLTAAVIAGIYYGAKRNREMGELNSLHGDMF